MRHRWDDVRLVLFVTHVLLLALLASSCGGQENTAELPGLIQGSTEQSDTAGGPFGFAPPAELAKAASLEDADRFCCGADYTGELPNQRVTPQGTQLLFSPSWDEGGEPGPGDLAYAMYVFSLDGYDDVPELAMDWGTAPADWTCCYVGLGNQQLNCWDWFTGDNVAGGLLTLEDLAPYLNGDGGLVTIVLMTGTDSCSLSWQRWGGNVSPVAGLEADPVSGSAPLAVSFDAGSSYDPDGTLADFEWDLDGDGNFNETGPEADARGSVQANYTYNDAGNYTPAIRLTDDDGAQDTAEQEVSAGGWVIVTAAEWGGYTTDLAVIDGCPAICYLEGSAMDKGLFYIRANTPTGTNEADWSEPITVDPAVANYGSLNMLEIAGNPAISYLDSENHPRYRRSTTTTGASEEDWSQVAAFANSPYNCSMAIVDGNPALSWGAGWELYYVRATTPVGANISEWNAPILIENGG